MKRALDLFIAGVGIILLLPVLIVVAYKIRQRLGSPVLFKQTRIGLDNKSFTLFKFKSMKSEFDADGVLLPDSERLSTFGMKLRASSLDELPSLYNVLLGEMSIVGPRPLLPEYLPLYSQGQIRRHSVKPGITGWAQINGRNKTSWNERFKLDVWYVDNVNFWLDFKIILLTISRVIKKDGIHSEGEVTMSKFTGNLK